MNVQEGARRMQYAGAWLAVIPACLSALVVIFQMTSLFSPDATRIAGRLAIVGGFRLGEILVAGLPGIALWIAGWIVEGFAKDPD